MNIYSRVDVQLGPLLILTSYTRATPTHEIMDDNEKNQFRSFGQSRINKMEMLTVARGTVLVLRFLALDQFTIVEVKMILKMLLKMSRSHPIY